MAGYQTGVEKSSLSAEELGAALQGGDEREDWLLPPEGELHRARSPPNGRWLRDAHHHDEPRTPEAKKLAGVGTWSTLTSTLESTRALSPEAGLQEA